MSQDLRVKLEREALEVAIANEKATRDRLVCISHCFGERIRFIRQAAGMSLRRLARQLEVSATYMSHLETGKRVWTTPLVHRVCELLNNEWIRVD